MIKLRVVIIVKCVKAREKSSVVAWEMANLLNNKNYCHLLQQPVEVTSVQKSENTYVYIEIVSHLALAEKHKNNNNFPTPC